MSSHVIAGVSRLPIEVLCKIFELLDHGSMLEASRVCRSWNDIISSSNNFLNSTLITVKIRNKKTNFKLTRNYHKLKIVVVDECELLRHHFDQIGRVCGSLKSLRITKRSSTRLVDLTDFLNRCENLTRLFISNLTEKVNKNSSASDQSEHIIKLPKISQLILHDSDWLLRLMDVDNLNFLQLSRSTEIKSLSQDDILTFLNKLQSLDKVAFRGVDLRSDVDLEPKFNWSHLKISDIDTVMGEHMQENWKKLLDTANIDSKVSIEKRVSSEFALPFMEMTRNQQKITAMKLEMTSFSDRLVIRNVTFDHVKRLKLRRSSDENEIDVDDWDDREFTRGIVVMEEIQRKFRNVEYLDLKWQVALFIGDEMSEEISEVFSNVKHLKIDSIVRCSPMFRSVRFANLVTLEIDIIKGNLSCFVQETRVGINNTTLRRLIMNFGEGTEEIHSNSWRRCLARLPTVQHFELNSKSGRCRVMKRSELE